MANYKTYTNSELEEELARLDREYKIAQNVAIENYQLMMELASFYGEVNEILNQRMGKKKEE